MHRRTRNSLCIWLILAGLANFAGYTIVYGMIGGDARNGGKQTVVQPDGSSHTVYFIRGHFLHGPSGQETPVSKAEWIYSYVHSISLWPTQGMMMICMLLLAQPHIIATMSESNWLRGSTFVAVAVTLLAVFYTAMSVWFTVGFIRELSA